MRRLWSLLQEKIENTYGIFEPEWVRVEVSRKGKIHVTIVSDQKLLKEDIRSLIQEELNQQSEEYRVGFINIYTTQMATELNIEKTTKNRRIFSWADGLNADAQVDDRNTNLNIISFYSYKGGVGRTIALIQTAYNLAKAGKRVLLLDLDIEAPSLHALFADKVNDEINGVHYGMVEYLYRTVVQKRTDVLLSNIYCPLQLSDIEGAMFLIPALKTMNKDYIYQIGRLQTEQIHDKDIFNKLFEEIERELPVDIILIDTRAGFNPWGSLSLFSLSHQIIFVAYPNAENVEGLNIAFEMLKNMGKKRYVVAMSKVVASDEGKTKALMLFEKLNISQDCMIPIYYQEAIALNNGYPITTEEVTGAYRALSNYILDSERIVINRQYLANGKKYEMLKQISFDNPKFIMLSNVRRFLRQPMQTLLVYRFEEELYGLENKVEFGRTMEGDYFLPFTIYTLFDRKSEKVYKDILANSELSFEQQGVQLIKAAMLSCPEEIRMRFARLSEWQSIKDIQEDLKEAVRKDDVIFVGAGDKFGSIDEIQVSSRIKVVINLTETFLERNFEQIRNSILGLIAVYKNIEFIQFKFVMEYHLWRKYQEDFTGLKANTFELNVLPEDIQFLVFENLDQKLFEPYLRLMRPNDNYRESSRWYKLDNRMIPGKQLLETIELLIGITTDTTAYSSSVCDYVYNYLNSNKQICYNKLLDAIQSAVQMELEGANQTREDDRLISFNNLRYALERLKE